MRLDRLLSWVFFKMHPPIHPAGADDPGEGDPHEPCPRRARRARECIAGFPGNSLAGAWARRRWARSGVRALSSLEVGLSVRAWDLVVGSLARLGSLGGGPPPLRPAAAGPTVAHAGDGSDHSEGGRGGLGDRGHGRARQEKVHGVAWHSAKVRCCGGREVLLTTGIRDDVAERGNPRRETLIYVEEVLGRSAQGDCGVKLVNATADPRGLGKEARRRCAQAEGVPRYSCVRMNR